MKEEKWYDHLKPSNSAELGCYIAMVEILIFVGLYFLFHLLVYFQFRKEIVWGGVFTIGAIVAIQILVGGIYKSISVTVEYRYKKLNTISVSPVKLLRVKFVLLFIILGIFLLSLLGDDWLAEVVGPWLGTVVKCFSAGSMLFLLFNFMSITDWFLRASADGHDRSLDLNDGI